MGLLGDLFIAGAVNCRNRTHNRVSRQLLGFIPNAGNVVICGGGTDSAYSIAAKIKEDSFIDNIVNAVNNNDPAICVYSDDSLTPIILDLLRKDKFKERICFFGHTHSYIPFDCNIDHYKVEQMMSRIIASYNHRFNSFDLSIQSTMLMLLNILAVSYNHLTLPTNREV